MKTTTTANVTARMLAGGGKNEDGGGEQTPMKLLFSMRGESLESMPSMMVKGAHAMMTVVVVIMMMMTTVTLDHTWLVHTTLPKPRVLPSTAKRLDPAVVMYRPRQQTCRVRSGYRHRSLNWHGGYLKRS